MIARRMFCWAAVAASLGFAGAAVAGWAATPREQPGAAASPASPRLQAPRPNIVLFVIDELGYYELSCMGHPELRTPHIDRLAAEGVRFTQFLAGSSVCAPTRACLMTGKHSGHSSLRTNAGWEPIRAGEETVASVLKRAGYVCGGFGKWGCGARGTSGVPETHGFDRFFGYYDQVHAHTFFPTYLICNSREVPLAGNTGNPRQGQTFSQYVVFEQARKFLIENKDRPFFLYLPWTPPHGLWGIPEDDPSWQLYKDKPWQAGMFTPRDARIYAAMVHLVDRQVGEILRLLNDLGLEEETIVFFSGDNGGYTYFADDQHPAGFFAPNVDPKTGKRFRGAKGNLYEGGLRVPFIVRWPGRIAPGRVSHHLGYFPDILPTLAELAGAECPKDSDGLSIVPELLGPAAAGRPQAQHDFLYWELGGQSAVRQGKWKAVRPRPNAPWELYDLDRDIEEKHDLAASHPEVVARLAALAEKAHRPIEPGQVYDRALVDKDRTVPVQSPWGGRAAKKTKPAKPKGRPAGKADGAPRSGTATAAGGPSTRLGFAPCVLGLRGLAPQVPKESLARDRVFCSDEAPRATCMGVGVGGMGIRRRGARLRGASLGLQPARGFCRPAGGPYRRPHGTRPGGDAGAGPRAYREPLARGR